MAKKILLVGYDKAPTMAFLSLANYLRSQGHEVTCFLLDTGKVDTPSDQVHQKAVRNADVVLCGISSFKNAAFELLTAAYAIGWRKPLGFYADTFDRWKAVHLVPLLQRASFLFVVNHKEKERAEELYPYLMVEAVGNPEWHKYSLYDDEVDQKAVRQASRALVDAQPYECLILVPFTKNADVNIGKTTLMLRAAIRGQVQVGTSFRYPGMCRMVINMHPGDTTPRAFYEKHFSGIGSPGRFEIVFSEKSADDLIPGADMIIGPSGSASVHAMARKITLVDITTPAIRRWLKEEVGEEQTYFSQHGASFEFSEDTVDKFTSLLVYLTERFRDSAVASEWEDLLEKQGRAQQRLIPYSVEGMSVVKMASSLLCAKERLEA